MVWLSIALGSQLWWKPGGVGKPGVLLCNCPQAPLDRWGECNTTETCFYHSGSIRHIWNLLKLAQKKYSVLSTIKPFHSMHMHMKMVQLRWVQVQNLRMWHTHHNQQKFQQDGNWKWIHLERRKENSCLQVTQDTPGGQILMNHQLKTYKTVLAKLYQLSLIANHEAAIGVASWLSSVSNNHPQLHNHKMTSYILWVSVDTSLAPGIPS